jgi:hypothetical protein
MATQERRWGGDGEGEGVCGAKLYILTRELFFGINFIISQGGVILNLVTRFSLNISNHASRSF